MPLMSLKYNLWISIVWIIFGKPKFFNDRGSFPENGVHYFIMDEVNIKYKKEDLKGAGIQVAQLQ